MQTTLHEVQFTLRGHKADIACLAYSSDGRRLASASDDGTVRIWDAIAGQESLCLPEARKLAFSPDGRRLVTTSWDKTATVLDASTGQNILSLSGHTDMVEGQAYSPDGHQIATASLDQTIKLWDAATGKELRTLRGHTGGVASVSFNSDGRRLASGSKDQTIKIWDVAEGRELLTLRGHTAGVLDVAISPDGTRLASTSLDGTVRVWNVETGEPTLTLQAYDGLSLTVISLIERWEVAFSPDGLRVAAGCGDRAVRVWDIGTGQEIAKFFGHTATVTGVAFSPDGLRLASASDQVKIWDVATGQELLALRPEQLSQGFPVTGEVKFSPDGRRLAYQDLNGVSIWDATSLTESSRNLREAKSMVQFLFGKPMLRDQAVSAIQNDRTISDPLRKSALSLAENWPEDEGALYRATREIVRAGPTPAPESAYAQAAYAFAESANLLVPNNGYYLATLGIAQYRGEHYKEALATLTRADQINSKEKSGSQPAELAFLAMVQHRLGQKVEAKATLVRLKLAVKAPAAAGDQENVGFQREKPRRCFRMRSLDTPGETQLW